jgi:ParB/RepB/Spo0J family partition protein
VGEPGILHVPLADLRGDPDQPRSGPLDREALDALKSSMAQLGRTVQYVTVSANDDGSFRVLSGHRRVQAAAELGWHWLPAVLVDDVEGDTDRLLRQIAENCARAGLRPAELCDCINQLRDRVEAPEIARATGVSLRTVYNYLSILEHPDLVDGLRTGRSLRSVLSEVAARRERATAGVESDRAPVSSPAVPVRRLRRSAQQLAAAWSRLDPSEQQELAAILRPLLERLERLDRSGSIATR